MNHVVEGILATYSPFYAPAAVNIYFLEDFRELRDALIKVRPTVFFSVPRFYEKMWDRLSASGMARRSMERSAGTKNRRCVPDWRSCPALRRPLDRCDFLISGSSPMSPEILTHLPDWASRCTMPMGLPEAPLVADQLPGPQPDRDGRRAPSIDRGVHRGGRRGAGQGPAGDLRVRWQWGAAVQ